MNVGARSILVVDDEPDIRSLLQEILEDEGYAVSVAGTASAAQRSVEEQTPDLVLLDIWMPDMDGVSLLKSWKLGGASSFPVIMISGHGTVETAVEATRLGAVDFIEKPLSLAKLLLSVERAFAGSPVAAAGDGGPVSLPPRLPLLVGDSPQTVQLRDALQLEVLATDPISLVGEAGSGRTLFAQNVHDRHRAIDGPFIALRCDSLSSVNAHRELYGEQWGGGPDERTGDGPDADEPEAAAERIRPGYLESAGRGTLLLSDVDQMPPGAQACLKRAIEHRGFMRQGGNARVPLRCRLLASSNEPLEQAVRRGGFDATLADTLAQRTIVFAPLREHAEDISALLEAFVDWHVEVEGLPYRHFTVASQNRLRNLDWPGNLLELKNLVQRLLLLGGDTEIEVAEIDRAMGVGRGIEPPGDDLIALRHDLPLREARADFERQYLLRCLSETRGNIGNLAKHVGMERTHLYRKLRSLDIDLDKVRD